MHSSKSQNSLAGYAQGLVIAMLAALLVLVSPFGVDRASAAPIPANLTFNNGVCNLAVASYSGDGSQGNPYIISDSDSLWEVADCSVTNSSPAHFSISRTITVSDAVSASTGSPIGYSSSAASSYITFSGVINGNGNLITGIDMSTSANVGAGLFAALSDASVSDLTISGSFRGGGDTSDDWRLMGTGALAQIALGHVTVDSVFVYGTVVGEFFTGGLIGINDTGGFGAGGQGLFVTSSSNHADVQSLAGDDNLSIAGGLVGASILGETVLVNSVNYGSVQATSASGGMVGAALNGVQYFEGTQNFGQIISDESGGGLVGVIDAGGFPTLIYGSTNSGQIIVSGQVAGGLVGSIYGQVSISNSANLASISASGSYVGGLIGSALYGPTLISGSYNVGNIDAGTGAQNIGGLLGRQDSGNLEIHNSYNTGTINLDAGYYAGGLVGYIEDDLVITNSYNSGTISDAVGSTSDIGGLVGHVDSSSSIVSSYNMGTISTSGDYVGGLIGHSDGVVTVISGSHNSGHLTGDDNLGGIVGQSEQPLSISYTHNSGTISSYLTGSDTGGLLGDTRGDVSIFRAYNSGEIVGGNDTGGLIGYMNSDYALSITIFESFNSGNIFVSTSGDVGGLVGDANDDSLVIRNSFNSGNMSGFADNIGGLVGEESTHLTIENSYNVGAISTSGDYSGLVDPGQTFTASSVYTNQPASASDPTYYTASTLAQMQTLELYTGWDFDTIWGFGSCADNNGLPMLRFVGAITYSSVSPAVPCTTPDSSNSSPAPIANGAPYEGPRAYEINTQVVPRGTSVVLTGADMNLVSLARAGSVALEIQERTATTLKLLIGQSVALGSATLYLTAINGTVYKQNAFTVVEGDASASAPTDASGSATTQRVNAGSFKGYVAIYALNYEGQRLSAKVGKDWVIVPSIPSATNNLYRHVEFTGAGVDCTVRIFIDRELVRTVYLTTR